MNFLRIASTGVLLVGLVACGTNQPEGASEAAGTAASGPVAPLPFNAGGLLAGSASPKLPDGEPGKVSVIQIGPLDTKPSGMATLPFAFRNNTSEGVSHVDWSGTARTAGSIVATGSSQGTIPAQVKPGEIGLAFIYFDGTSKLPPPDADYSFTVNTSPANQDSYNTAPLKVTEANTSGDAVVGSAVNQTGESVAGPFSVAVYCFDGDKLIGQHGSYAQQDGPIAADGQVTFTTALYGANCPIFAVGVGGFFEN